MAPDHADLGVRLVGEELLVPCLDGAERPYLSLDAGASTGALPAVAERVQAFLPWYSSVHRGAGWKSQFATAEYEHAREAALAFTGRPGGGERDDVAIICRNTTEAVNHLAYRLRFEPGDVVVTTVVEHHANLLPWGRVASRRYVECTPGGTFTVADVVAALDAEPRPRLLAVTGASNVTGWVPPIDAIIDAAHDRGVPVFVDAAQLAPHRPMPVTADFVAWSGHKMYAPFGAGVLVGPRTAFADGDPFLAGGGAVDLVDLDEVVWTDPPEREEAGSPNVIGAVALHAAIDEMTAIGWDRIVAHDRALAARLRDGLAALPGVRLLGSVRRRAAGGHLRGGRRAPRPVAARLSAEHGIGCATGASAPTRTCCACSGSPTPRRRYRRRCSGRPTPDPRCGAGQRRPVHHRRGGRPPPRCRRADRVGEPAPVAYDQDEHTGDFWPAPPAARGRADRSLGASCARG
ncbi:MAG: aminotransferase class V-fold PLP-dependent enzyme [Acidimicrobiales bacterium]